MKKYSTFLFVLFFIFLVQSQTNIFHFNHIKITGNNRTKSTVFLREMGYKPGDTINNINTQITIWQGRISGLNLFNLVEIKTNSDSILIHVKERIYEWGYPTLKQGDRNWNIFLQKKDIKRTTVGGTFFINNIAGLNQTMQIAANVGYNNLFSIGYTIPFKYFNKGWSYNMYAQFMNSHEVWVETKHNELQFLKIHERYAQQNFECGLYQTTRINYFDKFQLEQEFFHNYVDSVAIRINPNYLLNGNTQNTIFFGIKYISDHRNQRDYPSYGYLLEAETGLYELVSKNKTQTSIHGHIKANHFTKISQNLVWAKFFGTEIFTGNLPYNFTRQMGYGPYYVRGYERYVIDGNAFVLGKNALRYAIINNKNINFGKLMPVKKYRIIPFSVWLNAFADAGKIINPRVVAGNTLTQVWQRGAGFGIDITAAYSSLLRFDFSRNHWNQYVFNFSFNNAF